MNFRIGNGSNNMLPAQDGINRSKNENHPIVGSAFTANCDSVLKKNSLLGYVAEIEKEVIQTKEEVRVLAGDFNKLNVQYESLLDYSNQQEKKINEYKQLVQDLQDSESILRSSFEEMSSTVFALDDLIKAAETEMRKLIRSMPNQHPPLKQDTLQSLIQETFNKVQQLNNERNSLQEQLRIKEKECRDVTDQKNFLEEEIKKPTKEVEELKAKLNQLISTKQKEILERLPKNLKDNQETYNNYDKAYGSNLWGMTNFYRLNRDKRIEPFKRQRMSITKNGKPYLVMKNPPAIDFLNQLKRKYVNDYMRTLKTSISSTYTHKPLWEYVEDAEETYTKSIQLNLSTKGHNYCEPEGKLNTIKDDDVTEKFRELLSENTHKGLENTVFNKIFNNFKRAFFNAVIDDLKKQQELICEKNPDSGEFYNRCFEEIYEVINAQINNLSLDRAPTEPGVVLDENDAFPNLERNSEFYNTEGNTSKISYTFTNNEDRRSDEKYPLKQYLNMSLKDMRKMRLEDFRRQKAQQKQNPKNRTGK